MSQGTQQQLPRGWATTTLGDLLPLSYGKSLVGETRKSSGGIPVYGSSGVLGYHDEPLVQSPTLILGRKGTVGAVYYSAGPCWVIDTAYFAGAFSSLNLRFFKHFVESLNLGKLDRSTAIPGLSRDDYNAVEVFVPPEGEQQRILAEIEKQFTRLAAAVAALKRVQANLKRYRAAVLKAACEGRLVPTEATLARAEGRSYEPASELHQRILVERRARWEAGQLGKMSASGRPTKDEKWKEKYMEPTGPDATGLPDLGEGWTWATVEQVSWLVQYGSSAKTSEKPSGVPVLRMINITSDGRLNLEDLKYLPSDHHEFPDLLLQVGDLLFNRTNSPELVGKSAVYRGIPSRCSFASYLIRVCTIPECSSIYLAFCLDSAWGRTWIKSVVSQQVGQANVNGSKLQAFVFPLPPWAEQQRIIAEAERRLSIIDELEIQVEANLKRGERLRQAILKRAFEGKLVPQDPDDEPASVLLERICAERDAKKLAAIGTKKGKQAKRKRTVAPVEN